MIIPILFEDDSFIVIDKPSGVVVNRSISSPNGTIQDWAEEKLGVRSQELGASIAQSDFLSRAGIVHRIDKETSGILLIAKNEKDFLQLQSQFFARTVTKEYTTLVHGSVKLDSGEITAPVGRLPWDRMKFGVLPEGREAHTSYKVTSRYTYHGEGYSLLLVAPHTGRTHQIRIHLKYIGHSLVGDYLYAGRKTYRQDQSICSRIFLHAGSLTCFHPATGVPMHFQSPLPKELSDALDLLQKG